MAQIRARKKAPDMINVGEITGAHGVRGQIKVSSLTDFAEERFAVGSELYIEKLKKYAVITESQMHKGLHLLKFDGIDDRDLAQALLHTYLQISLADIGELPEGQFYQIRCTFNPVNKNHWIKKVFFDIPDKNVLTHHSTYLDNAFIDEAYHQRMERRKEVDPEGYRIYGLGEWGEVGGLILHNWTVDDISKNLNDYDDIAIGQDFGFNHANAILLLGIKDDNIYILDEIYVFEKETSEIIPLAIQKNFPKNRTMW